MTTHFTDSTGVCVLLKKTLRSMDEMHSMKTVSLEVVGRKYLMLLLQTELEMLPFCIVFISVLLVSLYLFIRRQYSYWERNNVPFVQPKFPFGNISIISENITQQFDALYRKNKGQNAILGVVVVVRPVLLLIDLELVRRVFIKDFQYFKNRGMFYNAKDDPLSANLFTLEYEKSSLLRSKLSSTFSSGKMKFMFPTIVAIANKLVDWINEMIKTDNEIEFHDLISRFATDVIANCVFGIECNSVRNPNAEFRKMGKRIFDKPELSFMKLLLASAYPTLARLLRVRVQPKCISDYFMNLACETIEYREKNNVQRNDFMDLLIRVKNSQTESDGLTMNEIAAQAFVFFTNGFERPALTLTYCLYELSLEKNKRIQEKAWQEIQTVLERHNGNLTYEAMNEMTYCEQIINGNSLTFRFFIFSLLSISYRVIKKIPTWHTHQPRCHKTVQGTRH